MNTIEGKLKELFALDTLICDNSFTSEAALAKAEKNAEKLRRDLEEDLEDYIVQVHDSFYS